MAYHHQVRSMSWEAVSLFFILVNGKLQDMRNYKVYKSARDFRKKIYKLVRQLPGEEKYNLVNQMRRASVSLTNCMAEGHGRYHYQENIQFVRQSRGSLEELIDDLNECMY